MSLSRADFFSGSGSSSQTMEPIAEGLPLESSVADRWSSGSKGWKRRLRCPRCGSSLRDPGLHPSCSDTTCEYSETGFPLFDTQPVLIDFAASIFDREMYCSGHGSALRRDVSGRSLGSRLHQFILGDNAVAASNCAQFIGLLKQGARRPVVLVIGAVPSALVQANFTLTTRSSSSAPTSMPRRTPPW